MSILDTFYILFKTDADKAAEDIKKVDQASDQAEDGLKKVDKAATSVGSSFLTMARNLAAPLLTLASVGSLLSIAVERAAAVRELDQFSSKLNSSISDVDAFQRTVKGMGGETAAALDSLVKISEKVNEAFADGESGARKDFDAWGLAFKNTKGEAIGASEAMVELAGNLENVSRAEALARIKKLGIEDAATIDMLLKGRAALEERIRAEKELGVVTEDQARATREYYGEMGRAQNSLTSFGNAILETFLPIATRFVRVFANITEWMARNKTLVAGFFIFIAGVITATFLPAMTAAAAAVIAATWPFLAIGAAILAVGAAFALAYEDVLAFLNGQPSLIGELAERYEWFGNLVTGLGETFRALQTGGTAAIEGLKTAWASYSETAETVGQSMRQFWATFEPIWNSTKELVSAVGELLSAIGDRIAGGMTGALTRASEVFGQFMDDLGPIGDAVEATAAIIQSAFTGAFNAVKAVYDSTIGLIAAGISAVASSIRSLAADIRGAPAVGADYSRAGSAVGAIGAVSAGRQALNNAAASPINGQTRQSIAGAPNVTQTSNVSVGNVTVNTQATDAAGVAKAVRGELGRQLRGTAAQFDDGVER